MVEFFLLTFYGLCLFPAVWLSILFLFKGLSGISGAPGRRGEQVCQ